MDVLVDYCQRNGVPYKMDRGKFRVMDLSLLPMAMREGFDERGYYVQAEEAVEAKPDLQLESSERPEEGNSAEEEEEGESHTLRGKLPEDFPGHSALVAAGIDTYGKLRNVGDVTEIEGIGKATEEKIRAALGESE